MRSASRAFLMPGLSFRRGPAQYEVRAIQDDMTLVCETGPSCTYSMQLQDFEREYMAGHIVDLRSEGLPVKLEKAPATSHVSGRWASAADDEQKRALRKFRYIKLLEKAGPIVFDMGQGEGSLIEQLRLAAKKLGDSSAPSRTTFYYWWRRYMTGGRTVDALLKRRPPKGQLRRSRLQPEVSEIIKQCQRQMLEGKDQTAAEWVREINAQIDKENEAGIHDSVLTHISVSTWNRHKRLLPFIDQLRTRKSRDKVAELLVSVDKVEDPSFPLQVVLVDHTRLQIVLYDPETDRLYSEVWMTALLCRRTRVILAFCIHVARHDSEVAGRCFAMMATPKTNFKDWCPSAVNDWPCWGVPNLLLADNGLEFIGDGFGRFCYGMGTNLAWAPAHTPEWKGALERWFRTAKKKFLSRLVGAVQRPNSDKRNRRPEKIKNALTMAELTAAIGEWVVDHYLCSKHRALGESPIEKWKREIVGVYRAAPKSLEDILVATGKRITRKLTREGIEFDGDFYSSEHLAELLARQGPGVVDVVVSEMRASTVHVFDASNEVYLRADILNRACRPEFTREHWKNYRRTASVHEIPLDTDLGASTVTHLLQAVNESAIADRKVNRREAAQAVRSRGVSSDATMLNDSDVAAKPPNQAAAIDLGNEMPLVVPQLHIS